MEQLISWGKKKCFFQGKNTKFCQMGSFQKQMGCYKEDQLLLLSVVEIRDRRLGEEIWREDLVVDAQRWRLMSTLVQCTLINPIPPNQSILKEISPEYSFEGLMLKLKLQSFGHLMGRADSLEKTLMLGKIEGRRRGDDRRWDGWMASLTQWTWVWVKSTSG